MAALEPAVRVRGFAPYEAQGDLRPFEYELGEIGSTEVLIRVTHCGLCFSDIDCIDNLFRSHAFPFVPGHEVIGEVAALGSAVKHLKIGQRVGVGPNRHSCMTCRECNAGFEQLCEHGLLTLSPGCNGGFADHICVGGEWAIAIPDEIDSVSAAPLMCAGLTTFTPLRRHVDPSMRVGIVGIGGLGHLALQFAAKMGAEVTAFAASPTVQDRGMFRDLGAAAVVDIQDEVELKAAYGTQDFVFSTIYGPNVSTRRFVRLLRPRGKLCMVGAAMDPMDMPAALLVIGQKSIVGSASGGRADAAEMLAFAARHDIRPITQTLPMTACNEAVARIRKGQARFRIVLVADEGAEHEGAPQ